MHSESMFLWENMDSQWTYYGFTMDSPLSCVDYYIDYHIVS